MKIFVAHSSNFDFKNELYLPLRNSDLNNKHKIFLRKRAIDMGYKLNEYGIFKGKKMIPTKSEQDVYKILNFEFQDPEKR